MQIEPPIDIKNFLALGPKFSIPPSPSDICIPRILSDINNIAEKITNVSDRHLALARATNVITNFYHSNNHSFNPFRDLYFKTKKFLKEHA